jgi:hypothetical protein
MMLDSGEEDRYRGRARTSHLSGMFGQVLLSGETGYSGWSVAATAGMCIKITLTTCVYPVPRYWKSLPMASQRWPTSPNGFVCRSRLVEYLLLISGKAGDEDTSARSILRPDDRR